jgi:hypothetical protein
MRRVDADTQRASLVGGARSGKSGNSGKLPTQYYWSISPYSVDPFFFEAYVRARYFPYFPNFPAAAPSRRLADCADVAVGG